MKFKYDTLALIGLAIILLFLITRTREHLTVGGVNVSEGGFIKCADGEKELGVLRSGKVSFFADFDSTARNANNPALNRTVALGYGYSDASASSIYCRTIPRDSIGQPLFKSTGSPGSSVPEGGFFTCSHSTATSGVKLNGKLSLFQNMSIATSYGYSPSTAISIDCLNDPMESNGPSITTPKSGPTTAPTAPTVPTFFVATTRAPVTAPTALTSSVATPTPPSSIANPIASCNIENFAPF